MKAVIWDLDGVIVDTARWHFEAWRRLCERYGRGLSEEEFRATFGQRNEEILRRFFGAHLDDAELRRRAEEKEHLFRAAIGGRVKALPGVVSLITALDDHGYAQGIGSSTPRQNITFLLHAVGIASRFKVVVAAEDVSQGKPDPELFLRAAGQLGVPPACCVVVEDAVVGVEAARQAGMKVIAVTNTRDAGALAAADLVVDSLAGVSVATVDSLMEQ